MKPRRRAFTLVELAVALSIGGILTLVLAAVFHSITDKETGSMAKSRLRSERAVQQALVMETLLRDVRSALGQPVVLADGSYALECHQMGPSGELEVVAVNWRQEPNGRTITRRNESTGEVQAFRFEDLLSPDDPKVEVRVVPMPDLVFLPPPLDLGTLP